MLGTVIITRKWTPTNGSIVSFLRASRRDPRRPMRPASNRPSVPTGREGFPATPTSGKNNRPLSCVERVLHERPESTPRVRRGSAGVPFVANRTDTMEPHCSSVFPPNRHGPYRSSPGKFRCRSCRCRATLRCAPDTARVRGPNDRPRSCLRLRVPPVRIGIEISWRETRTILPPPEIDPTTLVCGDAMPGRGARSRGCRFRTQCAVQYRARHYSGSYARYNNGSATTICGFDVVPSVSPLAAVAGSIHWYATALLLLDSSLSLGQTASPRDSATNGAARVPILGVVVPGILVVMTAVVEEVVAVWCSPLGACHRSNGTSDGVLFLLLDADADSRLR